MDTYIICCWLTGLTKTQHSV